MQYIMLINWKAIKLLISLIGERVQMRFDLKEGDATLKAKSANPALEDESVAEDVHVIIGFYIGDLELLAEFCDLIVAGTESCGGAEAAAARGGGGRRWMRIGTERGRFGCCI